MIRLKESIRASLIVMHGLAMLGLGLGLLYIRAAMTNFVYDIFGSVFALLLTAESLLFVAVVDWICAAGLGAHQMSKLRGLLLLAAGTAAGSVVLIVYSSGTIGMLCYVIAANAFLLSVGKLHLAKEWKGMGTQKVAIYVLAAITLSFSLLLLVVAHRDERDAIVVIGLYSIFIGIQMLFSIVFLQRSLAAIESLAAPNGLR